MKPFEIFRTGTHTTASGTTLTFSETDVAAIAASYDPAVHESPIVVGHPKTNLPAYGWVKSLSVRDGRLVAEADQVEPQFSEMVRAGRFKKRSAALYSPTDKGNPTPGQYYLRHVGFLGAEPPAVKGLKSVEFGEANETPTIEIEFAETAWRYAWSLESLGRILRGVRDYFIETADVETANRLVPSFDLDQLLQAAADIRADAQVNATAPSFSETNEDTDMKTLEQRQAELDARDAELKARETALTAKETTFSETEARNRAKEDGDFVASIVTAGRLPVGLQATATALFSEFGDGELVFSEGDSQVKTTGREAFRDFLGKLPVPVKGGELATGDGPDFSDAKHVQTAIETEIRKAKEAGETISPAEASVRLRANS